MAPTRRAKQQAAVSDEIKATARKLMAAQGAAGLSVRAIAREMGVSAPALYHYFESQDALVSALILDAFNALANAMERARDEARARGAGPQLLAVALAYRAWATGHPVDFQLIFGNPLPGYKAPRELTVPAAARGFAILVDLVARAREQHGAEPAPEYALVPAAIERRLHELIERDGYRASTWALYMATVCWTRMHGMVMLELLEQIQPVVGDAEAFYRAQLDAMFAAMGLSP